MLSGSLHSGNASVGPGSHCRQVIDFITGIDHRYEMKGLTVRCPFPFYDLVAMARVQIDLPERFIFSTEIPLYISHINYGGHLDNALLLTVVSEARVRFFKFLGYSELDVEGISIIMADAALQYRSEAFHGETMVVEMTPADFHGKGCDLVWRMSDKATGREVARGKGGMLFFDYNARKVQPVPEGFLKRVGQA